MDPAIKKGSWTTAEDLLLAEAQRKWGNCWSLISLLFPNRPENAIKNRWNSQTRKRTMQELKVPEPLRQKILAKVSALPPNPSLLPSLPPSLPACLPCPSHRRGGHWDAIATCNLRLDD